MRRMKGSKACKRVLDAVWAANGGWNGRAGRGVRIVLGGLPS